MKFDPQRMADLVSLFASPRAPGSPGESAALDVMANAFERSGWTVGRNPVVVRLRPIRIGQVIRATWVVVALTVAAITPHQNPLVRVIATAMATMLTVWTGFNPGPAFYRKSYREIPGVSAFSRDETDRPSVVIATRVATPPSRENRRLRWGLVAVVLILMPLVLEDVGGRWANVIKCFAWLATVSALVAIVLINWTPRARVSRVDNRTGLALLVELASIWPKSARGRVDVSFVAIGGWPKPDLVKSDDTSRPILLIDLVNPARGDRLAISGTPEERELARAAAADLWIPHTRPSKEPVPSFFSYIRSPTLLLEGVGDVDDPAASGRVAQLIVEIALRWGKTHAEAVASS